MTTKKVGMKKMPSEVAHTVPQNTAVPTACWLAAPAPEADIMGSTPRPKAREVMRMGRRRMRQASTVASMRLRPSA